MKKIKFVQTYSCEDILVIDENDRPYYSDESIDKIQQRLIDKNVDFKNYYYGIKSGNKLTFPEMNEQFENEDF